MYCQKCGTKNSDDAKFCSECGSSLDSMVYASEQPKNTSVKTQCPRCQGYNISFQREARGRVGAHSNTVVIKSERKKHGLLYWLFIGWWAWIIILPFKLILWPFKLLFGKKARGGVGFSADKQINATVAVCGDCGYSWKVNQGRHLRIAK